jgi:glycosyltransferase involved in cell wall biosynthesis
VEVDGCRRKESSSVTRDTKILLINQYFWPDVAATAQLLAELAEDLGAGGVEVTALAGRGSYVPGKAGKLPRREEWRGVQIRRVWCTSFGRKSALGRVTDYMTFLVSAGIYVALGGWSRGRAAEEQRGRGAERKKDKHRKVVVCLSTPPLVAVLGLLARLRGARFVYKVEDLYPDVAIMLGTLQAGSLVARWSGALSRLLLRRANAVVALDEGMAAALAERGAQRVEVIPNWADGAAIRPDPAAGEAFREGHDLAGRFVVLYSGNLGLAHRFDAVTGAARLLADSEPQVLFLFVGDGPRLAEVRRQAHDLLNVRFLGYQPRESLRALFSAADVHLIALRDEVAGLLFPSKYPAALAAGRPVLLVGGRSTDVRAEIERERLGWYLDHDPVAVRSAVLEALRAPDERAGMGQRGRRLFEARYARALCTCRWSQLLASVLE